MFFDSWQNLLRVVLVGVLSYTALVLVLRISGNRTLSKMNAFDLVVTVALGSTLATVILSKDVALAEGMLALALLIGLQWVAAYLASRSERWRKIIKADAVLLAYRGNLSEQALREERLTREEINAALRSQGMGSIEQALAVVLESDGTLAVVPQRGNEAAPVLEDTRSPEGAWPQGEKAGRAR